jgi:uncharacterized membrane protein YcaP (DUF421 family)
MFFDNWPDLLRTLVAGMVAYAFLVVVLRTSGKRTLSKLNAFDLIITVALGSTLATIVISRDVALAEGLIALLLLVMLQWLITWLSVRFRAVSRLVKSEPRLLLHNGRVLEEAMKNERVTEDELHAALRAQGLGNVADAAAVVMETDGSLSVIPKPERDAPLDVLRHVRGDEARR